VTLWGRHRSLARVRVLAVPCVLAPVLALSACGGSQTKSATPRRSTVKAPPTTVAPSTTSTTAPAGKLPYSFDDNAPPPPLLNTGTNYVAIAKSLVRHDAWLLSHHPDVRLIEKVAPLTTNPYKALAHDLPILRRMHRRYVEETSMQDEARVISQRSDAISLEYTQHLVREYIVDSRGTVVSEAKRHTTAYQVLLVGNNKHWLLAAADERGSPAQVQP
jgi:hypothetical protein